MERPAPADDDLLTEGKTLTRGAPADLRRVTVLLYAISQSITA